MPTMAFVWQPKLPRFPEEDVMTAEILDGKQIAKEIRAEVAADVRQFVDGGGQQPKPNRGDR